MATFQMPKVARGAKLQPAAPLRKLTDANNNNSTILEGNLACTAAVISKEDLTERKENLVVRISGNGASRRTMKLEKPRPLKATRPERKNQDSCDKSQIEDITQEKSGGRRLSEIERSKQLSPESAKLTTDKLIEYSLKDLDTMSAPGCNRVPQELSTRTRLMSQVSEDSGYGEMSAYSRQGSMLESLEETQDDVEWLVIDEVYTTEDGKEVYNRDPFYRNESKSNNCDNQFPTSCDIHRTDIAKSTGSESKNWAKWNSSVLNLKNRQCDTDGWETEICVDNEYKVERNVGESNGESVRKQASDPFYLKAVDMVIPNIASGQDCYPEDIDLIEMELESLRDGIGDSEQSMDSLEEIGGVQCLSKKKMAEKDEIKGIVVLIREPLTPVTLLADIYKVENEMTGGVYTAKGRRRMFRSHQMCRLEEKAVATPPRLQYSPEELLTIGGNSICQVPPESWSYLSEILPEVCLPRVLKFFDPQSYIDERSYVDQQIGYVRSSNPKEQNTRSTVSTKDVQRKNLWKPANWPDANNDQQSLPLWSQSSDSQRFKNHSTTKPFQTGSLPEVGEVDLDTKCDVRVRNTDKFATARNGIVPALNVRNVAENTFEPSWMKNSLKEPTCYTDKVDESSDLYVNRNLPDKCPW